MIVAVEHAFVVPTSLFCEANEVGILVDDWCVTDSNYCRNPTGDKTVVSALHIDIANQPHLWYIGNSVCMFLIV